MSRERVDMDRLQELVRLHRMGTGCREVCRLLRMGPNTERMYRNALDKAGLLRGEPGDLPELEVLKGAVMEHAPPRPAPQQTSSLERWAAEIEQMVEQGAQPTAIHDRLRVKHEDFTGSLSAVKRYCLRLKKERGITEDDVVIPVETKPGEVAQVDFGFAGRLYDPERGMTRKAWLFVMVLGFSRHMAARVVFDQTIETWQRVHIECFEELGGVPAVIVPDNLKAAVVRAAFGVDGVTSLNRSYRELARHYGFKVDPTPVRSPEKKGKVESAVKYTKNNFFKTIDERDVTVVRPQLARWVREVAGMRNHGTTHRKPIVVFEQAERQALGGLPDKRFELVTWKPARVHRDSHVSFAKRLYSVPWRLIGEQVWVRATASSVAIYHDDERVATHRRRVRGYRSTEDAHLPEHRADYRHRNREYWEKRAGRMGEQVEQYIHEVFDSDDVLLKLRAVISMVHHLETFPRHRARGACVRASFYGNYTAGGLKSILRQGLDLAPLPTTSNNIQSFEPRYARSVSELLPPEVSDELH